MKNILKKWQKEAKKKNKNKHQWGWFVNPNAGNVEYNNAFFNHVTGADGGDTSALVSAAAGGEGLGESMKQETVTLHYDDIEVEGNYGPLDWETGFPKYEYHELIDYDYEVDKDEVFEELWEMAFETPSKLPEAEGISEEKLEAYIDTNFYELFEKHYDELLERFYERAEEEANDKYIYDEYKYMESIDLAEALNSIDAKTCNKFDLVNSYHAASLTEAKKQKLATLIKKGASAHKLAEFFDDNSDWQIGLELFADNGKEYKVVSVLEDREVDGYELSVVSAIGNEASNADEEVYFVLLDSDIEWGPVETSEEALEWASDVQDGYYNTEEDNFDYDDDIDFTDLYGAHGEYDDDYGVQKRPSMKESAEDGQLDRNSDAEGNGRVKTFKLNGTTYKVSKLEDSFGKGGYVARWEDDSDNGLGYNNRGWISFDKNSYALHNEASKPIKDFMYVVSAHDRRPKKSVVDKLIATTVSMFGDDAVDTDSLDKKVGENLITEDWKDSSRYCVVTKMPPKFENILQGTSNDFDTAERIAIDAMKRYASSPWEDDDRKIEAIENMLILDTNADPSSKDYAQATSRMERVMDRLVDKIDPTDGLRESAMSELYLEIQEAGGLDAWIKATKEKLKRISKDLYFLDTQARREINAGGAFDSVEELEDAIEAEQREYNELKDKYDFVASSTKDNMRSSKSMNNFNEAFSSIRSSRKLRESRITVDDLPKPGEKVKYRVVDDYDPREIFYGYIYQADGSNWREDKGFFFDDAGNISNPGHANTAEDMVKLLNKNRAVLIKDESKSCKNNESKLTEYVQLKIDPKEMIDDIDTIYYHSGDTNAIEKILFRNGSDPSKDDWTIGLDIPNAYADVIEYAKKRYPDPYYDELPYAIGEIIYPEVFNEGIQESKLTESASSDTYIWDGKSYAPRDVVTVKIKDGVTRIGYEDFLHYEELRSVEIPSSVTEIDAHAFSYCFSLESINIPNSVTKIGEEAFSDCYSLKSINLPDSVTKIGREAFHGCRRLESVNLPNSVTEISKDAFYGCPLDDRTKKRVNEIVNNVKMNERFSESKLTESSMSRREMIDWLEDNYNTDENYEKLDNAISMIGYDADYIDDSDRKEGMYANFSDEELSSIIYILKAREANSSPRQSSKIKSDFTNMSREEMIDWLEDNWNTNEGYKQLNAAIDAIGYDSEHLDDSDEEEGMYANFSDEDLENIISVLKTGRTKDGHDTSVKPQRIPMTDKKAKDIFKLALNDLGRAVEIDKGTGSALAMYNVMIDGKEYQVQIYRMG